MDMFEEARAIKSTMELCGLTQAELAHQLGRGQSYIANKLRLLTLSPEIEARILASGVSERHARALLRLESDEDRLRVLDTVIRRRLSVRECEALIDGEVLGALPCFTPRTTVLDTVEHFRSALSGAVASLVSLGIDAKARTNYSGSDMYITVCIKDI